MNKVVKIMINKLRDVWSNIKLNKERVAFACVVFCGAVSLSYAGYKYAEDNLRLLGYDLLSEDYTKADNYSQKDNMVKEGSIEKDESMKEEEVVATAKDQIINEKDIERVHATYGFDVTNIKNVVADADYTFVAKVDKVVSTVYKFPVKIDDKWINVPYTRYRLKVVKNIKGKLQEGGYIEIQKAGGKLQNSSKYMAYDNDTLPSRDAVYIFSAYTQQDGSLLSTGRNSTIRIVSNYKNSVMYKNFVKASLTTKNRNRIRYRINSKKVYC